MKDTFGLKSRSHAMRYALAILAAVAGLLLRKALTPLLGTDYPFLTAWPAIVFAAWYGGIGPSIVSIAISVAGIWYLFIPPLNSFSVQSPSAAIVSTALFTVFAGFVVALGEANRRSKARSEREIAERSRIEDELREAQAQLENRVRERTAELNIANESLSLETARVKTQAEWLDAANDAIFVGDAEVKISYWNKGAERLYGWTRAEAMGKSPHELLQTQFPVEFGEVAQRRQGGVWEGELVHTKKDGTMVTVASRWTPLKDAQNNLSGWLEINRDVTDRKAAEAARQMNAQLLKMQDAERRRVARELYDSTGQMVIATMLNLGRLKASLNLTPEERELLSLCDTMLQNVSGELRTISHLLHPPLLDEAGLWTALEWYVEGFKHYSGIAARLERDSNFERMNSDLEVAIFRVVQECLTNVHRHSGSSEATVRLRHSFGEVKVEVQDKGRGIPVEKQLMFPGDGSMGMGLSGMRERISQLGGNLRVESNGSGTKIVATFPIAEAEADTDREIRVA